MLDLSEARRRLAEPPRRRGSAWAALGAGALAAASALTLCGAVVMGAVDTPSPVHAHVAPVAAPLPAREQRADQGVSP